MSNTPSRTVPKRPFVSLTVRMDVELARRLRDRGICEDDTASAIVRRALVEYLDRATKCREKKKSR